MSSAFENLPATTVLNGVEILTFADTSQTLSLRSGITWTKDSDELGDYEISVLRLKESGPRFALLYYIDAPFPCITVAADQEATEDDVRELLEALHVHRLQVYDMILPG